jgi:hypothetical protein
MDNAGSAGKIYHCTFENPTAVSRGTPQKSVSKPQGLKTVLNVKEKRTVDHFPPDPLQNYADTASAQNFVGKKPQPGYGGKNQDIEPPVVPEKAPDSVFYSHIRLRCGNVSIYESVYSNFPGCQQKNQRNFENFSNYSCFHSSFWYSISVEYGNISILATS